MGRSHRAPTRTAIDQAIDGGDAALAITLRLKLGRVLVEEMKQVDEALAAYRAVYDADSENAEALAALERLYRATSRYADLLGIYEKQRELSTDHGEKKQIRYEIAKLYETEIKDLDKAIDTYNGVLEDEPTDAHALDALDVLYGQLERWEPYVDTLRRRIELDVNEGELIDLKFRLGQTLEKHLGDAAGALENYREILFLDAQHDGAREALEALLQNADLRAEAAAILENIYEERGDWPKLLVALDILAEAEGDSDKRVAAPPQGRAHLERDAQRPRARLQGARDGAPRAAVTTPRRAPSSSARRASRTRGRRSTELYESIGENLTDAQLARSYWMRSAHIEDERARARRRGGEGLRPRPLARPGRRRGARRARGSLHAHAAVDRSHRRHRASHRADGRPGPSASSSTSQMARIYDEQLGRPDDAIASYKRVLELDPRARRALCRARRALHAPEMWSELAENLEAQLALATDDEQQIALMLRLAALRETQMSQIEQAIEGYRSVLERDIANAAGARRSRASRPGCRRTSSSSPTSSSRSTARSATTRSSSARTRCRSAAATTRTAASSSSTRSRSSTRTPPRDLNNAFATLARALSEDPANDADAERRSIASPARPAASRISRRSIAQLGSRSRRQRSGARRHAHDDERARLRGRHRRRRHGHRASTARCSRSTPRTSPRPSRSSASSADRALRAISRRSSSARRRSSTSRTRRRTRSSRPRRSKRTSSSSPKTAIAVYKKVLAIDADDVRALDALIKLYLGLSRWQDLLAVYEQKADLVADPDEKKRIYYQVGAVYERELGDVAQAIDTYTKILELDPDDLQALSRLDVLYEQAQNWQELLSVLTRESEMCDGSERGDQLPVPDRRALREAPRRRDPRRSSSIARSSSVRSITSRRSSPSKGLKSGDEGSARRRRGPRARLRGRRATGRSSSASTRCRSRTRTTRSRRSTCSTASRASTKTRSRTTARRSTRTRARSRSTTATRRRSRTSSASRWSSIAGRKSPQLYDAELDKLAENPERFVELGLRLAQIYEVQLEDVDNAIGRYRRVVEVEAENQSAVRSLDRLYVQTER